VADLTGVRSISVQVRLPDRLSLPKFLAVERVFREAADEDYAVARLAWINQIPRQFVWSSGQAVEKYLKAASLFNGMDAKFGHDWWGRFQNISDLAAKHGQPGPPTLQAPALQFEEYNDLIYEEDAAHFVRRIHDASQASVRYNEFTWLDVDFFDLHKLDALIRWLRGLCFPLDGLIVKDDSQAGRADPAFLGFMDSMRRFPVLGEDNFAFCPSDAVRPILWARLGSSPISVLAMKGEAEVLDWLTQSTMLTRKRVLEIQTSVQARRREGT
jgi:hypothetical protein